MSKFLTIDHVNARDIEVVGAEGVSFALHLEKESMWDEFLPYLSPGEKIYLDPVSVKQRKITDSSIFVLGPMVLVPVTTVINAMDCPRKVYVDHFGAKYIEDMRRILEGNLLHDVFSKKLALQIPVDTAIKTTIEERRLDILSSKIKLATMERYLTENAKILDFLTARGESEVDFENWQLGLHGKFDGISEGLILELKSSRVPSNDFPHADHNRQMNAYLYMLDDIDDYSGQVMYVESGKMNLKSPYPVGKTTIIKARNWAYLVISRKFTPLILRDEKKKYCIRCYHKFGCIELCSGLSTQRDCDECYHNEGCSKKEWEDTSKNYFYKFSMMLDEEQKELSRKQYGLSHVVNSDPTVLKNLESRGDVIHVTQKFSEVLKDGLVHTTFANPSERYRFRVGDRISGYDPSYSDSVTKYYSLTIRKIGSSSLELLSTNFLPPSLVLVENVVPSRYKRSRGTIFHAIREDNPVIKKVIRSLKEKVNLHPIQPHIASLQNPLKSYNDVQHRAILQALNTPDFLLIQGPAGTGKTSVIVEIINQLSRENKRILATAYTNMAVDNIGLNLKRAGIKFVRIGRKSSTNKGLHDMILTNSEDLEMFFRDDALVVLATTSMIAGDQYNSLHFDYAIVDEAAQMTEPETLKPLLRSDKFILVGDHKQLPAIVLANAALELGLNVSLFERLVNEFGGSRWVQLVEQYRMSDEILDFPNRVFYNGNLVSGSEQVAYQNLVSRKTPLLSPKSYQVISVQSDKVNLGSILNPYEAWITVLLISDLLQQHSDLTPNDIGVIAPFRAQVALIRRYLPEVSVDTVDRFQGSERRVIIYTTTTSGDVPISAEPRRINVALTRAREKMIVLATNHGKKNSIVARIVSDAGERNVLNILSTNSTSFDEFANEVGYDLSKVSKILLNYLDVGDLSSIRTGNIFDQPDIEGVRLYYGSTLLIPSSPEGKCIICLTIAKTPIRCMACNSSYHFDHLVVEVQQRKSCPYCRATLRLY